MTASTLITGASSGIGEAIARRLGPDRLLIVSARRAERLAAIAGDRHLVWPFDLRDTANIAESLTSFLIEQNAEVDSFVHCAGIASVLPARDFDAQTAAEIMNVNCLSALQVLRPLLRRKANKSRLAKVVFVSSVYSMRGARGQAAYSASKAALDGMMRSLALELAPNVRVNSVVPGGVPTPMSARVFETPELLEQSKADYPLRMGEVDDVVDAVEFLLSEKASWITGSALVVDGGMSIR